jgi:glycosyltransferase involved in cell wall biosynthesis
MVVIPNSVSLKADGPAPLTGKTVIAVGRYSYQKALDRLIDAWKIIMDRLGLDSGWRLRLVGDGETRPQLEAQIVRLGLRGSIVLGKVEKDMASVYHDASILALSSRYEGLPMVLLEAQSFGVPCVSFDCKCGPKDVIHDGENGLLVPEGDVPALAEALLKLMQDPEGLKNMGGAAYIDATRWQPDLIMQQWIDLFESVLSSRR